MSALEQSYLWLGASGADYDLLVTPELTLGLDDYRRSLPTETILFYPVLFYSVSRWVYAQVIHVKSHSSQQHNSSIGACGIQLLANVLAFAFYHFCSISLHLFPSRTQQDRKRKASDKVAFC